MQTRHGPDKQDDPALLDIERRTTSRKRRRRASWKRNNKICRTDTSATTELCPRRRYFLSSSPRCSARSPSVAVLVWSSRSKAVGAHQRGAFSPSLPLAPPKPATLVAIHRLQGQHFDSTRLDYRTDRRGRSSTRLQDFRINHLGDANFALALVFSGT